MPLQVEVLFELIKGLIKDLDGTTVDEVCLRVLLLSWNFVFKDTIVFVTCYF